jgi:type II secretory pathway pseudopilin PulG
MTLVELGVVLAVVAVTSAAVAPAVSGGLAAVRVQAATADVRSGLHLARMGARVRLLPHALRLAPDGRSWSVIEDPAGEARVVHGPTELPAGVVATANATVQFSAKGFATPFGTITLRQDQEARRLIVNLLGRVRMAMGEGPP